MNDYPEKTCSIDRLIRRPRLKTAAIDGKKTQQRRDGLYAYPGETFELDGISFKISAVERKPLADMTEFDANAEGYTCLDEYKNLILKMHPGMDWDLNHMVWVHHFERNDSV